MSKPIVLDEMYFALKNLPDFNLIRVAGGTARALRIDPLLKGNAEARRLAVILEGIEDLEEVIWGPPMTAGAPSSIPPDG